MKQQELSASIREETGKGAARRLRAAGSVPAVFYGTKTLSFSIAVNDKELSHILDGEGGLSTFFNLSFDEDKREKKLSIIKEIQIDPVKGNLIHVDFLELSMDKAMTAMVPVKLTGKAVGVEKGGTLQPIRRELEVCCLPKDLPEHIEIDVTNLDLGQSIHIDEVKLPSGIEAPHDVNFTVAVVLAKRGTAEDEAEAAESEEAEEEATAAE